MRDNAFNVNMVCTKSFRWILNQYVLIIITHWAHERFYFNMTQLQIPLLAGDGDKLSHCRSPVIKMGLFIIFERRKHMASLTPPRSNDSLNLLYHYQFANCTYLILTKLPLVFAICPSGDSWEIELIQSFPKEFTCRLSFIHSTVLSLYFLLFFKNQLKSLFRLICGYS